MDIVPGNMLWNTLLLVLLGFFIRLWLHNLTTKIARMCAHQEEIFNRLRTSETKIEVLDTRVSVLERTKRSTDRWPMGEIGTD